MKEINMKICIPDRWEDDFMSFLTKMEHFGNIGHSQYLGFFCDGDGDFRIKIEHDSDFTTKEPRQTHNILFDFYDAG